MQETLYSSRVRVLGVIAGLLSPIVAAIAILYAMAISPGFSITANALSDLGTSGVTSPFNIGVIIAGMFLAIFFISLTYLFPKIRIYSVLGAIGAISLELLGIFNETYSIHFLFSAIYFFLVPIAVIGISALFPRMPRTLKNYGIAAGAVSIMSVLFGMGFMSFELSHGLGFAVNELVGAAILSIWIIIFAFMVLTKRYKGM